MRDFLNTLDAQRARGFEIEKMRSGLFGKAARLPPLLVPVISGSLVRAEDIICAMELRCFGVTERTWLAEVHTRPLARLFLWLSLAGLLLVTALNITGAFVPNGPLAYSAHPGAAVVSSALTVG